MIRAVLLTALFAASPVLADCQNGQCEPPPAAAQENAEVKARADETLAVMLIVGGGIAGLMLIASLVRSGWNYNAPRPHKPWDNL